jgi:hypothetical protein
MMPGYVKPSIVEDGDLDIVQGEPHCMMFIFFPASYTAS